MACLKKKKIIPYTVDGVATEVRRVLGVGQRIREYRQLLPKDVCIVISCLLLKYDYNRHTKHVFMVFPCLLFKACLACNKYKRLDFLVNELLC